MKFDPDDYDCVLKHCPEFLYLRCETSIRQYVEDRANLDYDFANFNSSS